MAIKKTTRFETTDGTLYTNDKEAQKAQETINNRDRKSFRLKTWRDFVNEQLVRGTEEIQKIYGNLTRGNYGVKDSKGVFERLWVGLPNDVKDNQRASYEKLLNTIIDGGGSEAHIKADGIYDFAINLGMRTPMVRSEEAPYTLSAILGPKTYTLQAAPGGFLLSNEGGTIGFSTFENNQWSVAKVGGDTFNITWQAGAVKKS